MNNTRLKASVINTVQPPKDNLSRPVAERTFFRNGQMHQEKPLLAGQPHGMVRTWHKNGVLTSEESYQAGKLHGTCRYWDASGKLLGSYVMIHGTGTQKEWWGNGRPKVEVSILDGEFHGISRQWLMDGTLAFKAYFVKGDQFTPDQYQQASIIYSELPKAGDDEPVKADALGIALKEHDLFVQSLLQQPNKAELRKWLSEAAAYGNRRSLGGFPDESQALEFVDDLYQKGAESVIAADLYSNDEGDEFCDWLLVAMPKELATRKSVRSYCARLEKKLNVLVQPDSDLGESHILLGWG